MEVSKASGTVMCAGGRGARQATKPYKQEGPPHQEKTEDKKQLKHAPPDRRERAERQRRKDEEPPQKDIIRSCIQNDSIFVRPVEG